MKTPKPLPSTGNSNSKSSKGPLSPLTPKEKAVLDFIESHIASFGVSPSYQEIKDHFGLASFNSVQNYLKQLVSKGYVDNPPHQKRALRLLHNSRAFQDDVIQRSVQTSKPPRDQLLQARGEALSLPVLGRVAAGVPIERIQTDEFMSVPAEMVKKPMSTFVLRVEGDSMIEDGIFEGDFLVIEKAPRADNGAIVVAMIENEATVKRIYVKKENREDGRVIELRPSNSRLKSMWFEPDQVEVKGQVIGLLRKY